MNDIHNDLVCLMMGWWLDVLYASSIPLECIALRIMEVSVHSSVLFAHTTNPISLLSSDETNSICCCFSA
jgi:hypothetical protein